MSSTSIARVLRLLALLQTRRFWLGHELAARLGVSDRTLRRDIDQLRELGYHLTAQRGSGGGYSLAAGADLPPLLLDDDELVVLAVGLRTLAAGGLEDADETAASALAKLEQLLPKRLRRRVSALQSHTLSQSPDSDHTAPELIARLALACRDHERVRFGYTDASEDRSGRFVEPHSVVSAEQGWYLVAWDVRTWTWEAFRINRMDSYFATGARFPAAELTPQRAKEIARMAAARFAREHVGLLRIHAPLEVLRERTGTWARDATEESPNTTLWPISADSLPDLVFGIAWIPEEYEFEILRPPALVAFARSFGARLSRSLADP